MPLRFTAEEIAEMRAMRAEGVPQSVVAARFGTSKSVVGKHAPSHPVVYKCQGCPMLFYAPKGRPRSYCDSRCQSRHARAEQQHKLAEFRWIVGTDSWESIALRLGFSSRQNLAKFLYRAGEVDYANAAGRSGPMEKVAA